ncbi:MAG: tetratricopeptide repeat protein [Lewinellaceae bacterium]|nr:tetratricopeptide repeat protein [Lewinellaceae bacterium]
MLLEQAAQEISKSLALDDKTAYGHNEMGLIYMAKGQYRESETSFRKAIDLSPTWALPWANLCGLCGETKDYQKGNIACDSALLLRPEYYGGFVNAGLMAVQEDNLLKAEDYFLRAITLNKEHYLSYERLGYIQLEKAAYEAANENFEKAAEKSMGISEARIANSFGTNDVRYEFGREIIALDFTQPIHSEMELLNGIKARPEDPEAHFELGCYYAWDGNLEKARERFKKAIALNPDHKSVFSALGYLEYTAERFEAAELCWIRHLEIQPKDTATLMQLAFMYENWHHPQKALHGYEAVIQLDSLNQNALQHRLLLLRLLGKYDDMDKALEQYAFVSL